MTEAIAQTNIETGGYRVKISQFEGPLDLLLYLIEKAEVDIRDIYVSEITSEFLAYLSQLDELDMEQASGFITVAATLVYMKSRSLIPKPKIEDESEEEEDEGEALIRRLREYKAFREASRLMRAMEEDARDMRSRLPDEFPLPPPEIILRDTDIEGLYHAFLTAIDRLPQQAESESTRSIDADRYTIRSCTAKIRDTLQKSNGRVMFLQLLAGAEKMEMIVTLMALLEMLRRGEIHIFQEKQYGDIAIVEAQLLSDDDDINYEDEA